ncbi:dicarboxylate/amino acid:cation symporter [Aestuariicella hydrocarbonica]|uniref:Dicarboxylate/amino acid:cation symporter n=1 Tax=Pseudomaricurvus hydrocarbonicus TaxID=1470433 RepID=A0A9E5JUY9_9GAMM|nr:dicarboxylate/amino acid:cation symporter [Aestuariicella hydrocarbonica]NHO65941.1 dicarboxylate/amino acid:cation symporter [Aestuariicella hydrocarbonica]
MANSKSFYLEPLKKLSDRLDRLIEGRLWMKVLIGLGLGIGCGLLLGPELNLIPQPVVTVITSWLALPGQLFLALIQMIVVPLVIASIVRGLAANRNPKALKQIGLFALGFILCTTVIGTVTGIGLAQLIKPGHHINSEALQESGLSPSANAPATQHFPSAADMPGKMVSLFPHNPMASMVSGEMLQVVLFAAILGFALISIAPKQAQPLFDLLGALQEVSMRVVSWAMLLAPLAVFGLITRLVANLGLEVLTGMLLYVLTVVGGLLLLTLFYLLVIKLIGQRDIKTFISDMRELLLLAFSTSSSAAVMPLSLKVTENTFGVRPGIARFLIPLGATINMTGTALYQGVATVFLAQVFAVELTLTNYVFVVTMAIAASIGSPATPGAGIVILSMVLEGVGIPAAGVALLLGVDRVLDMCRTTINVLGDVVMCCVTDRLLSADADITLTPVNEPSQ